MGQFSWLDCITGEQVLDDTRRDVYVLVPLEFGGGHIKEECYDGYGRFGGHDIFDLVVDWNAKYLNAVRANANTWVCEWVREENMAEAFKCIENGEEPTIEKRIIGIGLACYDNDNARLRYPIKITHDKDAVYEFCSPSLSDPNQGWSYGRENDEEEDWEYDIYDDYEMEEI